MIGPFKIISIIYSLVVSFCLFSIPLGDKNIFEHIHFLITPAKKVVVKKGSDLLHHTLSEAKNIGTQLFSSAEPKIKVKKYSDKVKYQLSATQKDRLESSPVEIQELPERELDEISNEDKNQLKQIFE
jgi:hypothetical protein